jgi:ribonuclease HI
MQKSMTKDNIHYFKLFVDGASRNNPGLAGVGVYLVKDDVPVEQQGFYIGVKTNNQAEYLALILGLLLFQRHAIGPNDMLLIISDSELMVKQLNGEYRVKNQDLRQLFDIVKKLLSKLHYNVAHAPREENCIADSLANKGIDHTIRVPADLLEKLDEYSISL